jgi:predicted ATPase/class 3 adenylate cyclase
VASSPEQEMPDLPSGTVTLLFTDIEGSTRLLTELGDEYADALSDHRRVLRQAFERHGGVEVDTQGDAFFVAFSSAAGAVAAADQAQAELALPVRMGIHTGEPQLVGEGYVGLDVHQGARICGVAHGGQIVVSQRARDASGGETVLRDLGLHRLKDLSEPVRLYQVGDREFPRLRSLNATNLPGRPNPLVGRERQLEELTALLGDDVRLVTVTGPGGAGKTRLALEAAAELTDAFPDGVFWAPLASVREAELALPTIEESIGAKAALADHVDEKRMLLLLDNFEQLLPAAPELAALLRRCPNLKLLVTSRAALRLSGERELHVPPLQDDDAVSLFLQRARAVRPELAPDDTVAEICRRLDGLPLAIELAAARVRVLEPQALLAQLERRLPVLTAGPRDLPARHQTLWATIDWSYNLLEPAEQTALARLAVFAGRWSAEAAELVCEARLETLESLAEQSLVGFHTGRFTMLQTIREFALERLRERREEDALHLRHAEHFVARAEQAAVAITTPEAAGEIAALEQDNENMLAALAWLVSTSRAELALRMGGALRLFWGARGHAAARPLLEQALKLDGAAPGPVRATALATLASCLASRGELDGTEALLEEAQRLYEEAGDRYGIALSVLQRAFFRSQRSDLDAATELASQAQALTEQLGDGKLEGLAYNHLGLIAMSRDDLPKAAQLFDEAVAAWRESGHQIGASAALTNLATVQLLSNQLERAETSAERSLAENRALGHELHAAGSLGVLGSIALKRGRQEEAAAHLAESLATFRDLSETINALDGVELLALTFPPDRTAIAAQCWGAVEAGRERLGLRAPNQLREFIENGVEACRSELGEKRFQESWSRGRLLSIEEAIELALSTSEPTMRAH